MIDFLFGQNISISVLLVFRLILFDLSHRTKRDQSLLISLLICFRDLLIRNMLVSSAKWWTRFNNPDSKLLLCFAEVKKTHAV